MTQHIFVNRFYYPDISATSQMLSDLAIELAASDLNVVVLCSQSRYNDPSARLPASETINNVKIIRVRTTSFGRGRIWSRLLDYLSFYVAMLWCLARLAKKGDWIIAKTDPPLMSISLLFIAKLKQARLANWLQDVFPEVAEVAGFKIRFQPLHKLLMGSLYRMRDWSLKHSAFNVVLSAEMQSLISQRGIPEANLAVIPNWSNVEEITPKPHHENPLRSQWNLENCFVVGYSGNMGIAHDLDTIVEAATLLKDVAGITFLMVGEGFRKNFMVVDVETRGLEDTVIFKPYQPRDQLSLSLGCADVHLVSLRPEMEGLIVPSKFYGVCAAGRPVIYLGLKESAIGRSVNTHQCGAVVSNGGAELAKVIEHYAQNPANCAEQGQRARQRIAEKDTVVTACRKWQQLFQSDATD